MKPLINWEELQRIGMPAPPPGRRDDRGENMWDRVAPFYNQMAAMEKSYTKNQLDCFDTAPTDTVLDIGCGPGRISVQMAQRAKSVTSIDASEKMLTFCRQNADNAGLTNLTTRLLDWNEAVLGENLEQHDIVIASRSVGMHDLKKLNQFAKKYAVLVCWANAPSIPEISGYLFEGVEDKPRPRMMRDRRLGYNVTYNMVYDLGLDPNIRIVTDGFTKDFANAQEAYDDLRKLGEVPSDKEDIFRRNVDKFLTPNGAGGVTYRCETKTYVLWWEPKPIEV